MNRICVYKRNWLPERRCLVNILITGRPWSIGVKSNKCSLFSFPLITGAETEFLRDWRVAFYGEERETFLPQLNFFHHRPGNNVLITSQSFINSQGCLDRWKYKIYLLRIHNVQQHPLPGICATTYHWYSPPELCIPYSCRKHCAVLGSPEWIVLDCSSIRV